MCPSIKSRLREFKGSSLVPSSSDSVFNIFNISKLKVVFVVSQGARLRWNLRWAVSPCALNTIGVERWCQCHPQHKRQGLLFRWQPRLRSGVSKRICSSQCLSDFGSEVSVLSTYLRGSKSKIHWQIWYQIASRNKVLYSFLVILPLVWKPLVGS